MAPTAKDLGPLAESLTASPTPSATPKDPAATHGDPAARQIFTSPNTSGADATGGDPPAPQILSSPLLGPHASSASPQPYMNMPADLGGYLSSSVLPPSLRLASDLLHYPEQAACIWPAFEDLRAAAHATRTARLRLVISAMVSEARIVFGACFLLTRSSLRPSLAAQSRVGEALHGWIQALLTHGSTLLPELWHWSHTQCQFLHAQLTQLVAPTPWSTTAVLNLPFRLEQFKWDARPRPFPAGICAFLHALRVGAPWARALDEIGGLADGFLSPDGRIFATSAMTSRSGTPDRCVVLTYPDDPDALTSYFAPDGLVAITSTHSLLPLAQPSPTWAYHRLGHVSSAVALCHKLSSPLHQAQEEAGPRRDVSLPCR